MRFVFVIALLFVFSSCKKKITQFHLKYDTTVEVESAVGSLIPIDLMTPEITTNSEFEFENNNTKAKYVNSIFLKDLTLTITAPQNETFSFLSSLEMYLSAPNSSEIKVAFKDSVPDNVGQTLVCDLSNVDLQEFVKQEKFTLRLVSTTDEFIPENVTINVHSDFLVDAKLKTW